MSLIEMLTAQKSSLNAKRKCANVYPCPMTLGEAALVLKVIEIEMGGALKQAFKPRRCALVFFAVLLCMILHFLSDDDDDDGVVC